MDRPADPPPDPSYIQRVLIAVGITLTLLALALFLWYSIYVVLLFFGGVLVAVLLRALADLVSEHTAMSHGHSLLVVLLAIALVAGVALWIGAPPLYRQINELVVNLPAAWADLRDAMEQTVLGRLAISQLPSADDVVAQPGDVFGRFTGIVSTTLGFIVTVVVVAFTGLFLAINPRLYVRGALHLLPERHRHRGGEVMGAIGYTLKWWLIGQSISMVVIAIATTTGLWILGIPLALALGVLAGLFNFIPNFGPLISLVPATLIALTISPWTAMWVIVLFLVLQNLEGYVLTPMIQRRAVNLPPAVTIASQVLLGILVGPLGLVLATPLAAAVLVAVKMIYIEDVLGDRIKTPAEEQPTEVEQATEMAEEVTEESRGGPEADAERDDAPDDAPDPDSRRQPRARVHPLRNDHDAA